jgi:DNA-binding MarR family transcriptional regulator
MEYIAEAPSEGNKGEIKFPSPEITFEQVASTNIKAIYKANHVNGFSLSLSAKRNTPDLTAIQKLILSEIGEYANASGTCHPSQTTVARTLNLDRSTVVQSIRVLRLRGYISDVRNTGRGYTYLLNAPKMMLFKITPDVVVDNISCSAEQQEHNTRHNNEQTSPQPPTIDTSQPLANCAQQSQGSFADGASPLAQSATLIVQPMSAYGHSARATRVGNTYYCEDPPLQR